MSLDRPRVWGRYPQWNPAAPWYVRNRVSAGGARRIESDILEPCRRHRVASIGFDPRQSTQMAQRLRAEGVNMLEFRATTQNFSPAILELDAAMRSGRLRHDGDRFHGTTADTIEALGRTALEATIRAFRPMSRDREAAPV